MMAFTGQIMVLFVIIHLLGNTTVYFSSLNAYAAALRAMPLLLWLVRLVLAAALVIHVYLGIVLTLENRKAKSGPYAVSNHISATFAGRNMIWTGTIIGSFLVYHLLHFTIQVIYPQFSALQHPDALGRPDVFMMVVQSFRHIGIVSFYVLSASGLLLHLSHGIQSSFQTWGLNNDRSMPYVTRGGTAAAVALFLAYAAIPVVIVMGIIKR